MKIYLDLQKQAITKTTDEKTYEGDFYSNVFEVLFYNYTDTTWFPTMSQLAPNGRSAGEFTADALEVGESHTYVEDGVTYLNFTFTMGANWVLMKGRSEFYIWFNRIGGSIVQKKCVGRVNVMIDQSTTDYFIADPLFNPAVKTYIDACIAEIGDGSPKYFDTASNIANCTEDKGLAVATDTGHLYYWDATSESTTKYTDSGLVYNDLSAYYTISQINTLLAGKQNTLTFDNTPTANSTNPVTSGGVKTALDAKADKVATYTITQTDALLDQKQDVLTFDSTPTANSTNPVTSGGVKNALDLKANSDDTYTRTVINNMVADLEIRKANKSNTYTKSEIDTTINGIGEMLGLIEGAIGKLESVQNVVDVVATKSALNSYNTSKLEENDKIQVIADETHDGASTIYNWTGSAWQYVGAYGTNSYTKAESDNKFAIKTTAVTHDGNQLIDSEGNNIYPALEPIIITNNQDWTLTSASGWTNLANTRRFVINYGNEIPVNDTFNLSLQAYYSNNLEYTLLVEIWTNNNGLLTLVNQFTYTCPTHSPNGFYENVIIKNMKNTYQYPLLVTARNTGTNPIKYVQSITGDQLYSFSDLTSSSLNISNAIILNNFNFRYYLSYTTDVVNNIKDDIDTINSKLNSYVTVKKDGTGDYSSINDALTNIDEGTPIIVYEGVYEENIRMLNTSINIRGVDKNKCIIKSINGGYDYPTLYVKSGVIRDLTIIAEYVEGSSTEIGTSNGAYAVHIETEQAVNTTMEIDNCILRSDFSASLGVGLRNNSKLIVRDSVLINNQISGRGSYESNGGLGALYTHDSMGVQGNSKLELYNNLLLSNLGSSLCLYHLADTPNNSVDMILINNVLKDAIHGYSNNIWNRNNAFDYFSINVGYGNSNSILNE